MATQTYYRKGASPAATDALQRALNRLGYKVTVDGVLGPQTRNAVKAFQGANALKVDGKAGAVTVARMRDKGGFDGGPDVGRRALVAVVQARNTTAAYAAALESAPLLAAVQAADAKLVALVGGSLPTPPAPPSPQAFAALPLLAVPFVAGEALASSAVAAAGWAAAVTTAAAVAKVLHEAVSKAAPKAPAGPASGEVQTGKGPLRGNFSNMRGSMLKLVHLLGSLVLWLAVGLSNVAVSAAAGAAKGGFIIIAAILAAFLGSSRKR
jgi:peptidoglycan hydrolase-like protein with peptidoglycan-binding domain